MGSYAANSTGIRFGISPLSNASVISRSTAWQPARSGRPPLAEIHDLLQPVVGVRELPFVDQQAGLRLALQDEVLDLVEGHDEILEVGLVEPQREVRGRQRAGDRDRAALDTIF